MRNLIALYVGALAVMAGVAAAGAVALYDSMGPDGPVEAAAEKYGFNAVSWEFHHAPEKWLFKLGDLLRDNHHGGDEDVLERYFNLTSKMRVTDPESPEYAELEEERGWLENAAENTIEGRVTAVLEDEGLTLEPPLFSDIGIVFPPVDFEFDAPPRVLVTSPRDRIELRSDDLLRPGLGVATAEEIEAEAEQEPNTSALVVQAGGIALYPSVVLDLRDYRDLVDTVCHEWTHQYLAFYPLGASYFSGSEARTLNESVANLAGHELARLYFERYGELDLHPEPTPEPAQPSPSPTEQPAAPAPSAPPFDFTAAMRALRVQVEEMLADGKVAEAEALMDKKRDEFEAQGHYIRKLNQAYFAFHGFYADTPGSIDPLGPKLQTLLEREGSPGAFLHAMRSVRSREDVDELLAASGG